MPEEKRSRRAQFDPIIRGLMQRLPKPGEVWADHARKEWLATLEANLKLIYPDAEQQKPAGAPHAVATPRAV